MEDLSLQLLADLWVTLRLLLEVLVLKSRALVHYHGWAYENGMSLQLTTRLSDRIPVMFWDRLYRLAYLSLENVLKLKCLIHHGSFILFSVYLTHIFHRGCLQLSLLFFSLWRHFLRF